MKKIFIRIFIQGLGIGIICISFRVLWQSRKNLKQIIRDKEKRIDKFWGYFNMLDKWLLAKENNKCLEQVLMDMGYHKIAIYGLGKMGEHLIAELQNSQIEIVCGIDKKNEQKNNNLVCYQVGDSIPEVDAIIVTSTFDFYNIKNELKQYTVCDIVSLEEVILKCER